MKPNKNTATVLLEGNRRYCRVVGKCEKDTARPAGKYESRLHEAWNKNTPTIFAGGKHRYCRAVRQREETAGEASNRTYRKILSRNSSET